MLMNSTYYEQGYRQGVSDVINKVKTEIENTDFDFGDYYDHTDTIRKVVCEILDQYLTTHREAKE